MEAPGELHDLLLSMAAFATGHPRERASVQSALSSLPRAPSSTLYYRYGSHGLQVWGENREPSASGGGGQAQAQQQQGSGSGVAGNRRGHAFDFGVGSSSSSSSHAMGAAPCEATRLSGRKRVAREDDGHGYGFEFEGSDQGRHAARGQACGLGGVDQGPSGAHDEDVRGYGFGDSRCVGQGKDAAAPTHQLRIGAGRDQGCSVRPSASAAERVRMAEAAGSRRETAPLMAMSLLQAHGDACAEDQGTSSSSVQQLPNPGSVGGSDGMIAFEVGKELALHGFIVSSPWNEVWLGRPLIFHDLDLVRAMKEQGDMSNERIDLSGKITSLLHSHPGPVSYFRIDSSVINNGSQQKIEEWCDVLRKKNVETVVMLNCQWPSHPIEFPLQSLNCSSLRTLRLCFFSIPDMYLDHVSSLAVIDLACCRISDENLFALVCQCVSLRELDIGMFSEGKVRILSESLKVLQIWWSSISHVTIQSAPKLEKVLVGAAQRMESSSNRPLSSSRIDILGAPIIQEVWFKLLSQTISIDNVFIDLGHVPITSLRKLQRTIAFKERKGRHTLLNFFKSCTELKELVLWREDKVYFEEECDVQANDWSFALKDKACLKSHLQVLRLFDYGGGETEIAIASAVLEHGASMENLTIVSTTSNADDILSQAKQKLEKVERLSPKARINLKKEDNFCGTWI